MDVQKNRYPGAQPFSDDELSHRVFFGREDASRALADKVLTSRLVVVYGRSGLGKTSLLNAGLTPLLREEGYFPLFLRINDTKKGPFQSILEAIPLEASRQGVEYIAGLADSLWSFFKTAEFWRGDLLLTPVLILDQFEELFTLQNEEARERLLDELSYLIRGVPPPSAVLSTHSELSGRPPEIRILLSLREEYLGFLEEAANQIPQIFDARYRLAPLDFGAAEKAIIGPARIDDPALNTKPFILDCETITVILNYLARHRSRPIAETKRYVEPFHLQLICQKIEQIASALQHDSALDITITIADIGGETALAAILRDFYHDSLLVLHNRRARQAARHLCEEYLINAEGRRLSLEENEICRQLSLTKEMLGQLVSCRLLRVEHRSDSVYYELSHDALIEPILASQHRKATVTSWLGIVSGTVLLIAFVFFFTTMLWYFMSEYEFESNIVAEVIVWILFFSGTLLAVFLSVILLRNSARSLLRQRLAHEALAADVGQVPQRGNPVIGFMALITGVAIAMLGLLLFIIVSCLAGVSFDQDLLLPAVIWFDLEAEAQQVIINGIGLDLVAYIASSLALILMGGRLMRWGIFCLVRYPNHQKQQNAKVPDEFTSNSRWVRAAFMIFFGSLFILSAIVLGIYDLLLVNCTYLSQTLMSDWLPLNWFTLLSLQCAPGYYDSVSEQVNELIFDVILIICCLLVGASLLRKSLLILPYK